MNFKKDLHVDKDAINQIIYNVLNDKLVALKNNKETMSVLVNFEPNGKITDISFTLKEKTQITLEEIEDIDQKLRKNITASFTGEAYKHYIAINYDLPVIVF
jgi:protein-arginine kinase